MIIRGQLHDNSCKKNVLNNSVPSVFSVLDFSSVRTKKLRNLKTYKPKLKVSIPPKPEAAQRVLSSELWVRSCEPAQLLTFNF